MHLDLAAPDGPARLDADVCVVGAGAAGLTATRRLLATGRSVVLLESGGLDFEPESADLNAGEGSGRPYYELRNARLRFFGGTTAIWGGRCAELDAGDFDRRDWVPGSGWPFGKEELRPYYGEARRALDLPGTPPEAADLPGLSTFDEDELRPRLFEFDTRFERFTFRACPDVTGHPRCRVVLHATVTGFETVPAGDGHGVSAVTARSLNGRAVVVGARQFVLAAGGIENARLLLASGEDGGPGLGNRHDRVGRCFMEHPHGRGGRVFAARPWLLLDWLARKRRFGRGRVSPALASGLGLQRREATLNCALTLAVRRPAGAQAAASTRLYKHVRHVYDPDKDARRLWKTAKAVKRAIREGTDPLWPWAALTRGGELTLVLRAEQAPDPESRIALSASRDALGMRKAELTWRLGDLEVHSARALVQAAGREFERLDLGRVEPAPWLRERGAAWESDPLASAHPLGGFHHMGTTRMSDDPRRGVTDGFGRVHGVANLHVAGSSVFPTGGWANPTLTLIALAMRTADRVASMLPPAAGRAPAPRTPASVGG